MISHMYKFKGNFACENCWDTRVTLYTYVCLHVFVYRAVDPNMCYMPYVCVASLMYGVATISRMLKNIYLFAEYRSLL